MIGDKFRPKNDLLGQFWAVHSFGGRIKCAVGGEVSCTCRHLTPPLDTFGCAQKVTWCHQNCSKRLFFGPNFQKSQIYFRLRADFRKKVCKNGSKTGQNRGFLAFYPILPYFGPHLGVRRLNLGLRATPRGLKAARRWDGD